MCIAPSVAMTRRTAFASETVRKRGRDGNVYSFDEFSEWYGKKACHRWREAKVAATSPLMEPLHTTGDATATAVVTLSKTSFPLDMQSFMNHLQQLQVSDTPFLPYNVQLKVVPLVPERQGDLQIPITERQLCLSFFLTIEDEMETQTEFDVRMNLSLNQPAILEGTMHPPESNDLKPSDHIDNVLSDDYGESD
jgi:hypothetical protein